MCNTIPLNTPQTGNATSLTKNYWRCRSPTPKWCPGGASWIGWEGISLHQLSNVHRQGHPHLQTREAPRTEPGVSVHGGLGCWIWQGMKLDLVLFATCSPSCLLILKTKQKCHLIQPTFLASVTTEVDIFGVSLFVLSLGVLAQPKAWGWRWQRTDEQLGQEWLEHVVTLENGFWEDESIGFIVSGSVNRDGFI